MRLRNYLILIIPLLLAINNNVDAIKINNHPSAGLLRVNSLIKKWTNFVTVLSYSGTPLIRSSMGQKIGRINVVTVLSGHAQIS